MTGRGEVARLKRNLDNTANRIAAITDIEAQSDFSRFLCVLVSGYFETAVAELLLTFTRNGSRRPVQSYVESQLNRVTNLNSEKLLQLIGAFDDRWKEDLWRFMDADGRSLALNSLISLRHQVAHGGHGGVTYRRITEYYLKVDEIVWYLADVLDPVPTSIAV